MKLDSIKYFLDEIKNTNEDLVKHYERVAMLNFAFARELSLNAQEQSKLYFIGLLHEIGKFNNEKYEAVYPEMSAIILRTHSEFAKIANIVAQCEENIDGSGYPNHLKGEDIHIFAMITHLSNKYDHCRIDGMSHEEAVSQLKLLNDIVCPRKLVAAFTKMFFSNKELSQLYKGEN